MGWSDGRRCVARSRLRGQVLGAATSPTRASDTRAAVAALAKHGIDVLMFAGGDGTARDLTRSAAAIDSRHRRTCRREDALRSVHRYAARRGLHWWRGCSMADLVAADTAEVRDIDEAALREGRVATRYYGELSVPRVGGFLQHVKTSGREVEELVLAEIAESIAERVAGHRGTLVLGPGSTLAAIKTTSRRRSRRCSGSTSCCEGRHRDPRCGCARTCSARRCRHRRRPQLHARPGLPDRPRQSAAHGRSVANRQAREHLGCRELARNCCRSKADRCSSTAERRTWMRSCADSSRSSAATKTRCFIASVREVRGPSAP